MALCCCDPGNEPDSCGLPKHGQLHKQLSVNGWFIARETGHASLTQWLSSAAIIVRKIVLHDVH
jgi:hypothetical protein